MSAPDTHAPFAPSGLSRVVSCPGSFNLIRTARADGLTLDESDTPQSMEGTAAHWVNTEVTSGRWPEEGSLAPNGVAVTDEMLEGAELWLRTVEPYLESALIEYPVDCSNIHPDCRGTPDISQTEPGIIRVSDYKFGHRYVSPFENWQLIAYASGLLVGYYPTVRIELTIVQPRSYHRDGPVRTWVLTGEELRSYVERLSAACRLAASDNAECIISSECRYCPGRHVCDAAQRAELAAFDLAGSTVPLDITVEAKSLRLRQVRRAIEHLKQMESGLSEDLTAAIRRGESVPGFGLEAGSGREKWTADLSEVIALGTALGIEIGKPAAITPAQARKAGMPADLVAAYSARSSGETKLVESGGESLRRIFGTNER